LHASLGPTASGVVRIEVGRDRLGDFRRPETVGERREELEGAAWLPLCQALFSIVP